MRSSSPSPIDRTLWPSVAALVAVMVVFESTSLDLRIQDLFYHFDRHAWWVDVHSPLPRILFYTGPKALLYAFAILLGAICLIPSWWNARPKWLNAERADLWMVIATLAAAPAIVATGKATTHVFCPYELQRYGGAETYVKVFERYAPTSMPARFGRGFPAGHASGGFALMSLAGLARTRRRQWVGLAVGVVTGSLMGGYQMLRGAHFLSHTLVSAILCWLVFLVLRRVRSSLFPSTSPEGCPPSSTALHA